MAVSLQITSITWLAFSVLISSAISYRGYKRRSLSLDGAILSFFVGLITFYSSFIVGCVLITFFLTSSLITNVASKKETIEEDFRVGGQRNAIQVISNSLGANICLLLYLMSSDEPPTWFQRALLLASIAHYACCCSDTWSSELGALSKQEPVLITSFFTSSNLKAIQQGQFHLLATQPVPAGTNGGVSVDGTVAGIAGSLVIGLLSGALSWFSRATSSPFGVTPTLCLMFSLFFGTLGTLLDSLIGAEFQYSGLDTTTGKVLSTPPSSSSQQNGGSPVKHITGRPILSNNMVNLVTSSIVTLLAFGVAAIIA